MASSVDPDQTAPIGAVCSGSMLFASILNLSVMLGNYLQQTTSADEIFRWIFFLALKGLSYLEKSHRQTVKAMLRLLVSISMAFTVGCSDKYFCVSKNR